MNARTAVLAAVISLIVVPAHAHHSFAMFDMDKDVTYNGVVADYKWINPHVHITVDIKAGPGRRSRRRSAHGTSKAAPRTSWGVRGGPEPRSRLATRSHSSAIR